MPTRLQIGVVVVVIAGLLVAALTMGGQRPPVTSYAGALSAVITASGLVALVYDRLLWHVWPVRLVFPKPDLRGTWKGRFESVDPGTGAVGVARGCFLVVRQSGFRLRADMLTEESKSSTLIAHVQVDEHGGAEFLAVYKNEPRPQYLSRSRPHTGSFVLRIQGQRPNGLTGSYWTDRGTAGELVFDDRHDTLFDDHGTASAAMA